MAHRILKQVTILDPTEQDANSEPESRCSHHEDPSSSSGEDSCPSPEHLCDRDRDIPPRTDEVKLDERLRLLEKKKVELPRKEPAKAKKLRFWRPKKLRKEVKKVVKREEERKQSYKDFVQQKVKEFKSLSSNFPCFRDVPSTSKSTPKTEPKSTSTPESLDSEKKRRETLLDKFRKRDKGKRSDVPFKRDTKTSKFSTAEKLDDPEVLNETYMRKLVGRTPKCAFPIYLWHYYETEYVEQIQVGAHQQLVNMMSAIVHVDSQQAQWQLQDQITAPSINRIQTADKSQESPEALKYVDDLEGEDIEKEEGEEGGEEGDEEGAEAGAEERNQHDDSPHENENEGEEGDEPEEDLDDEKDEEANNSAQEAMDDKEDEEEADRQSDTNTVDTQTEQLEKIPPPDDQPPIRYRKTNKLFNLFNFTDRASQGCINLNRDRMTQTSPVPMGELNAFVCSYVLYDVYQKDIHEKETRKDCEGEADVNAEKVQYDLRPPDIEEENSSDEELEPYRSFHEETAHKTKILERMAVQNTIYELTSDMQFYDDPADEINKGEGSVLPLWTFKCDEFDTCCVTSIHFSPSYPDMLGVSHGTFDFDNNICKGFVSVYSIKDPMTPEYKKECSEPITSFDFHPTMISYIAFSTFGGNVHCCDVRDPPESENRALHSAVQDAHLGIIWQILWDPDSENLNFYTISSDGTLCRWNVRNAGIVKTVALVLHYPDITDSVLLKYSSPSADQTHHAQTIQAMATTMVFDPHNKEHIFIGTSEGMIIKCSLIYTTSYLMVYYSHTLSVSRIHFNPFIKSLFISSSEDRKVNIHEQGRLKPLYSLSQSAGVTDVQWAPYSSTVFALVTMDCHIVVYDLNISKAKPVCCQYVISRLGGVQLTTLKFSPTRPIVMIGDTSGSVLSLKLSPNLRIKPKKGKRQTNLDPVKLEVAKLQTCINYIREPDSYQQATQDDSHNQDPDDTSAN